MMTNQNAERCKACRNIQTLGFTLYDLLLFLDTHPCDQDAQKRYFSCLEQYNKALAEYAEHFGPMNTSTVVPGCEQWEWVCTPFPWELGGGC